ncbi:thioredoxin domain-containing protein [Virgibacillus ainsalahensis]
MTEKNVMIYIGDNNSQCKELLEQMEKWDVSYKTKNVSQNKNYMKELQDVGIYGTPATFIEEEDPILGCQINKIKYNLGIGTNSYESPFHGGYENNW